MSELSGNEMSTDLFDEANPYRLVFDTETTGFPSKKVGPKDDAQNVVVELGASLVDVRTWKVQQSLSFIIQTPVPLISDFLINEVHGISNELSLAVGMELDDALAPFIALCKAANWQIVGHNVKFDKEMMAIMLQRSDAFAHMIHDWNDASFYCTMDRSTNVVCMPPTPAMVKAGRGGQYKAPKLQEAFEFFTKTPMGDAHRVHVDVAATVVVFKHLYEGDF
jgi:DNA polymerase-3 subunit epsilon